TLMRTAGWKLSVVLPWTYLSPPLNPLHLLGKYQPVPRHFLECAFYGQVHLSARHDFWPRPLYVRIHPTVTTCKANTERTLRFLRVTEPCDKCGVGQLVMTCRPAVVASPDPSCPATGRGDLDDPRLVSRNGRVERE